ncbi:MAG TPA: DUF349 domain-containing protein [Bacteroidales bacterium]|nr:DUF349 domain-containing protein [Bacteroidales bacterium]
MTKKDEPTDEQLPTQATLENQNSESVEIHTPVEEVPAEEPEAELPKEEFAEPEVTEPEAAETGVEEEQESVAELLETEPVETDANEPEEDQPEEAQPEEEQPVLIEPEVAEPEKEEPEMTEPEVAETEREEPEMTEPEAAGPELEISSERVSNEIPPIHVDYSGYTRQALIDALGLLLSQRTIQEISRDVENIRSTFYRRLNQESDEKLKKFLSEGGAEEEFKPAPDPLEDEFKILYEQFRVRRSEFSKVLEEEKDINLRKKLHIIDQIKHLLNTQESLNRTFNEFRELQHQWREIGPVPQTELHSLWENYHHHVELFYDYIKINKELRDLDLKKNLEQKIQICESAEELLLEPSVIKAFGELQKMHSQWREIGPVPIEKKDEIWERFREATNQVNKKHQDYYLNLKDEQKKNLDAKNHLCDQIDEILKKEVTNPKDWNDLSQEVVNLQRMWRSIGFAPRRDNNKIYDRFRAGCDEFFNRKREYFSRHRDDQHENLQLKTDLCVQAESLMNSTEWRKTADELVIIQKKWKEVGPIPRKYSDALWNRFRAACDAFFKRKSEFFSSQDTEQVENLKKKQELIEKVRNFSLTDDHSHDLGILKDIQKEFTSIGHVPLDKKDEVQRDFREGLHKLFNQLEVDEPQKEIIRYKQKVDNFVQSPKNRNRISSEREKLVNKLKQMESDIVLWENNIGFFAKSQKSESLIREVESKILQAKEKVQLLKDKIDMLDRFES